MKKAFGIFLPLLAGIIILTPACDMFSALKKANETNAFSALKMISVSQNIHLMEHEQYAASIQELSKNYGSERTMKSVLAAWHRSVKKDPFNGYYFADIEQDESGNSLDTRYRYGLTAYPSNPGKSGDITIVLLMDLRQVRVTDERADTSDEIQYWTASYKKSDQPQIRWPSEDELSKNFSRIKMRTPAEALEEARKLKQ